MVNHCVRVQLEHDLDIELLELKCNVTLWMGWQVRLKNHCSPLTRMPISRRVCISECCTRTEQKRYKNGRGDPKGIKQFMQTQNIKSNMISDMSATGCTCCSILQAPSTFSVINSWCILTSSATATLASGHPCSRIYLIREFRSN